MLKGLKGLIFEDEGDDQGKSKDAPAAPAPAPAGSSATVLPLSVVASAAAKTTADQQYVDALNETVNQNTPAVYVTFQQLLTSLAMIPDERARYQAAVASLEATGKGNKAQLKTALTERIAALAKAKGLFESELEQEARASVGDKSAQIAHLDERIRVVQEEFARLQQERGTLQSGVDDANRRLEQSKSKFETAHRVVENDITTQNQKITLYLG